MESEELEERQAPPPAPPITRWVLLMVPVGKLFMDRRYQRGLVKGQVKKLVNGWDWDKYQPIVVSHRVDDRYAVIAGQQRTTAAIELGIPELPALLQTDAGIREEAKSYLGSGEVAHIQASDRFKARLIANDPKAYAIWGIVEQEGFKLYCLREEDNATGASADPFSIQAVYALETIFEAGYLNKTLNVINNSWGDKAVKDMVSGNILRGTYLAVRYLEFHEVSTDEIIKAFNRAEIKEIMDKGYDRYRSMVHSGRSIDAGVASVLVEQFNWKRKETVPEFTTRAYKAATASAGARSQMKDPVRRAEFIEAGRVAREEKLVKGPGGRFTRKT